MAMDKVNNYSQVDSNILEVQLTTDKAYKSQHTLTLTNYDNTTVPAIAAGSVIEVNGTMYKADSEEAISTTDPVTSATVADGTVYVVIVPGATTATAAFTATAPTWSDSKQGWYGTGGQANYRYAEFIIGKKSAVYLKNILCNKNILLHTFLGYADGTQTAFGGVRLKFDDIYIDTASGYDSVNIQYEPQDKGVYFVQCVLRYSGSPTSPQLLIRTDKTYGRLYTSTVETNNSGMTCSQIVICESNTEFIRASVAFGGTMGTVLTDSYLFIRKIDKFI